MVERNSLGSHVCAANEYYLYRCEPGSEHKKISKMLWSGDE